MKKEESRFAADTVFEGMTSIRAVIKSNEMGRGRRICEILVDSARTDKLKKELSWLRHVAEQYGFPLRYTDCDEINSLTVGNTHGGIVALCGEREIPSIEEFEIREDGFYVMIEGIEDPYNFGYALRSLYACGVDGIVLSPRNWMSAAGVVCRSSAGASEVLPICISDPASSVEHFKKRGYKVVCAGIRDSVSSFEANMKNPIYLIVGGEKRGISASILAMADKVVRIDYGREFPLSLSAASAASMLAYEVMRANTKK